MTEQMASNHENLIDHIGVVAVIGVMVEWLPVAVAFLAMVWYLIRIGEWIYEKWGLWKKRTDNRD